MVEEAILSLIYANVCVRAEGFLAHHEGEGVVVQPGGRVVVGQVGVQVPRRVRSHGHSGLDAQLPVDEESEDLVPRV